MTNKFKLWIDQSGLSRLAQLSRHLARSLFTIMLVLPFLTGCKMDDPMVKEMIEDMGAAYAIATQKKGDTQEERDTAVSRAVQKHFPPGMKVEEAFKHLLRLKEQGFKISESRHEGGRAWPEGELKPYLDEVTRRNLQQHYPKGVSKFIAEKQVGTHMLIVTNHVGISFRVIDGSGVISDVEGSVWANGI